jgi:DNA-binding NarL/FixJ family response regulator
VPEPGEPIRVLIADDQQLLRTGFRVILQSEPGIEVVGEAEDGVEAVAQARSLQPDVVLMDIRMPRLDGLSATEHLVKLPDGPRVVVLTTFDHNEYVVRALRAGAYGDALIEPSITRRLVEQFAAGLRPAEPAGTPKVLAGLTDRELEVLRLIARGLSNAEIADEITVAETTVKTHVARILAKLRIRDRVQAVVLAYESGFVTRSH